MQNYRNYSVCQICRGKFKNKYILRSNDNLCYCKDCFKNRFCTPSGDQRTETRTKSNESKSQKLIPYPEIYMNQKIGDSSYVKSNTVSMMSLSKKPLQCPKADCNKFVSIFTLQSHFKYEHKEVPIILTQLDARSALEFYPRDVRYGITQCIVLLNVINYDFSNIMFNSGNYYSKTNIQSAEPKPVMILLATRVAGWELAKGENEERQDDTCGDDETNRTYVECDILRRDDKIIIWMTSNIFTNLSYTVAVSTLNNKIRQKYFGPMLTLGDNPVDLCREGNCLIMTHFHINGMTENGKKPLALDVVIHSPD